MSEGPQYVEPLLFLKWSTMRQGPWNEIAPPSIFATLKAKPIPASATRLVNVRCPPTSESSGIQLPCQLAGLSTHIAGCMVISEMTHT